MSEGEPILYAMADGAAKAHLRAVDGMVWFTQGEIAELLAISKRNVSMHMRYILGQVDGGGSCCRKCDNYQRWEDLPEGARK